MNDSYRPHCSTTLRVVKKRPASRERQRPEKLAERAAGYSGRLRSRIAGTNLVEVVMGTLMVSVVLLVSLETLGSATKAVRVADEQDEGRILAESLMAEVLAKAYEDLDDSAPVNFGPESDEPVGTGNRLGFDDIDDYHYYYNSSPMHPDGTLIAGASGWTRSVLIIQVEADDPTTALPHGAADEGVRSVVVEVISPSGDSTFRTALRSKTGAVEQLAGVDTDVVTDVVITLSAGGEVLVSGANLINHAKD